MGKATGFMEFNRVLPVLRPPVERVTHWNEFHDHSSVEGLREQAARCMDCGVPFCQSGVVLNGAAAGCPLHNYIPEWNHLVYKDDWRAALDLLHSTNNFPEFTGRVCPAPCEASCVLSIGHEAVTIKSIECEIVDRGFAEGWIVPEPPAFRTGKRVAVVGSGPAGLACAAQLNKAGHMVNVFEKSDRVGGLLMYGIPNMKLDKQAVQRRVDLLAAEGVEFVINTEIGTNFSANELLNNFDAVVLCGGASKPRDLQIEGRELSGIHFAMDYLHGSTKSLLDSQHTNGEFIDAQGKDVVVIGGGDTGTDCVATALRQGCRSLVQLEILPQPANQRGEFNPWPQWPRVHRVDYGQEEASAQFGDDPRAYSVRSKSFLSDGAGNVSGIEIEIEGSSLTRKVLTADLVLLAMGFTGPKTIGLIDELGIALTERGTIKVDENKMTNLPGVFAAGDIERGQSLVVWAIADGRKAAASVDRYLSL
jgi:glutamate synthase (NADPH/NADH) small chain